MNNKVVYSLYQSFQRQGCSVLRFNFRGVGRSQGVYDRGEGELSDAAAALDWLQAYNPNAESCWIAGFSFGAWIAMQLLMRRPEINGFVCIAPPANLYDFNFLAPCPASGLMVQGNADQIVQPEATQALAKKLTNQRGVVVTYTEVAGADHFFSDKIEGMAGIVDAYITPAIADAAGPATEE